MSRFLSRLCMELMVDDNWIPLENHDGRQLYDLYCDLVYQSDVAKMTITVPKGFVTDLASVPRIPGIYDALGDIAQMPAVVHDFAYSKHIVDRETADAILKEAMEVTGVPWWRRQLIWAGVRAFGGSHWDTP